MLAQGPACHAVFCLALIALVSIQNAVSPAIASTEVRLEMPVPRRLVHPGETLSPEIMMQKRFIVRAAMVSRYLLPNEMTGTLVARRPLMAGRPVLRTHVESPALVREGTTVVLVFQSGLLEMTATGRLLEKGEPGQLVRAVNVESGVRVRGWLRNGGRVDVGDDQ